MKGGIMSINVKSVLKSGILAGLLINISAISMLPVVGNDFDLVLASRNLPPLSKMAMLYFSLISFINGVSIVFIYAVVKDKFEAGLKMAVLVSFVFWFLTYFLSNVSMVVYGFMPVKLTLIGTIWGLGELLLAGIVGAKLYKEDK